MEEGKAVEERRGRRYKEGDQMVEEGNFFWKSILGKRIFIREESKEGDGTGSEENWRRGLNPKEELHSENKEVAIGFIGTWARGLGNPSVS